MQDLSPLCLMKSKKLIKRMSDDSLITMRRVVEDEYDRRFMKEKHDKQLVG